jgi:hypothetical protein
LNRQEIIFNRIQHLLAMPVIGVENFDGDQRSERHNRAAMGVGPIRGLATEQLAAEHQARNETKDHYGLPGRLFLARKGTDFGFDGVD